MLIAILTVVAIGIALILILATRKPDVFRIERSISINGAPVKIFHQINNFQAWGAWSPWEKVDPAMHKTFTGPTSGKGAVYEWLGNKKVGQGRMEILESISPTQGTIKLDFIKPFEGHNTPLFTLQPQGESTQVTWAMEGPMPFGLKIMHVFINMDKMIGKNFEAGLANLKSITEK